MDSSNYTQATMTTLKPQKDTQKTNLAREDAWMKLIETIIIFTATWLNPHAGLAIFTLKLCFQTLAILRHHHRPKK